MIEISFFLTVLLLLSALFLVPSTKSETAKHRIGVYLDGEKPTPTKPSSDGKGEKEQKALRFKLFFEAFWARLTSMSKKRLSKGNVKKLERKLLQAGSPLNMSAVDYRLIQILAVIGMTGLLAFLAFLLGVSETKGALLIGIGFVYALVMPPLLLQSKIKKRAKLALKELPDFVDLLTVSLEAGLGFDSALTKVIDKQKGILSDEFRQCLDEIRLGKTRREGLSGIKERLNVDELTTLINSVIRAEKLGVGMVQVLRVQSAEVRDKRRQRAEEQAMKAPIKMLFPLVLFIFPSLFVIILGPAAIQIMQVFHF